MAELLLINPKGRNMKRKSRKPRTAAQKRATAKMIAANRARAGGRARPARKASRKRRSNPVGAVTSTMRRRVRRNPARARRRNPIAIGSAARGMLGQFKDALIGGAGSVAVDLAYGQVTPYLPASLQRVPGSVGLGDAVKAVFTVAIGQLLAKPTRGVSRKMAAGALTVQAAQMIASFVPGSMRMGYANPARIVQGNARVNPIQRGGMNAYVQGPSPLLNAYVTGPSPLLSGAREREGVTVR